MRLHNPSGPLRSSYPAVEQCRIYARTSRPSWQPADVSEFTSGHVPSPEQNRARHSLGRLKAEIATIKWTVARIAKLEPKLAK